MKKTKQKNPAPKDGFDRSFDELIEKGFIQEVGIGPDGEPEYRLTTKGLATRDQIDVEKRANLN